MRFFKLFFFLAFQLICVHASDVGNSAYVDPFWGWGAGNVTPAAMVPMGAVKLSPTMQIGFEKNSGYYKNMPILGFTHTQTSGTGGAPRYGNIMVTPIFSGTTQSPLRYENEQATPGNYSVSLLNGEKQIDVKLTATHWVGIHLYKWSNLDSLTNLVTLQLDLTYNHTRMKNGKPLTFTSGGECKLSDNFLTGYIDCQGGWGGPCPYRLFFAIKSAREYDATFNNQPIENDKIFLIKNNSDGNSPSIVKVHYPVSVALGGIEMRVAISYLSEADALRLIKVEENRTFEEVSENSALKWSKYLDAVQVVGGTQADKTKFYSALRNALVMPTDVSGHTNAFDSGQDHFWDYYATWDLYRSSMPLYTLLYPALQQKLIRSYLNIYKKYGWLPDAWIAGNYATIQGGSNADVAITDAIVKNLGGFDRELACKAMRTNAEQKSDNPKVKGRYIQSTYSKGYQPSISVTGSVSRAIEYAYNDFCISQSSKELGDNKTAKTFEKYANQLLQLFHPDFKMFWAKDSHGNWMPDFSPLTKSAHISNDPYFYEGGSIIYSAWLPQNMKRYIKMCGGRASYEERLDSIIQKAYFKLTNEPEFGIPYLYNYIGKHSKTVEALYLCDKKFGLGKYGLPGQDDSGAMSAWFVFRCMGFYPVAGQNLYLLGVPLFDRIIFKTQKGDNFTIEKTNASAINKYVKQIWLDGKPINKAWLTHNEIINNSLLTFEMTNKPTQFDIIEIPN